MAKSMELCTRCARSIAVDYRARPQRCGSFLHRFLIALFSKAIPRLINHG